MGWSDSKIVLAFRGTASITQCLVRPPGKWIRLPKLRGVLLVGMGGARQNSDEEHHCQEPRMSTILYGIGMIKQNRTWQCPYIWLVLLLVCCMRQSNSELAYVCEWAG